MVMVQTLQGAGFFLSSLSFSVFQHFYFGVNQALFDPKLIKLVLPKTAQLGFHFLQEKQYCCICLCEHITESSNWQELNTLPLCYEVCDLPLCNNRWVNQA